MNVSMSPKPREEVKRGLNDLRMIQEHRGRMLILSPNP